jgi:hypothetical protein
MLQSITKTFASFLLTVGLLLSLALPSAAQDFRVEGAGLEADPVNYSGPCPGVITFKGKIQASGAGRVKYTYFYSDGATGPEGFVDFEGPGVKHIETSWRLGGASLTHYEGWAAIRILSPNSYESNKAKLVLDCKAENERQTNLNDKQPSPQSNPPAPNFQADNLAALYLTELPRLSAPQKNKLDAELSRLQTYAENIQPALAEAQKKSAFDSDAMRTDFQAIAEEQDVGRRAQRQADFKAKYEPQFFDLAKTAGFDLAAQRQQMISVFDLSNARPKEGKILALEIEDDPQPTPPPAPPPPDVTMQVLAAPFTSGGTLGEHSYVAAERGEMSLLSYVNYAGSTQRLAFTSQALTAEAGVRRVRVFATLDPVHFNTLAGAFLAGYASSEAIVNLRVMEGSRVVASDRVSLGRAIAAVFGVGGPYGTRSVTLQCEFTRATPDDATTYNLIAEIEGWAGAGAIAEAQVSMEATLQRFQVYLHRH